MTAKFSYQDIPNEDKKRLAAIIREGPKVMIPFVIFLGLAVVCSGYLADIVDHIVKANFPKEGSSVRLHFYVLIAVLIPIVVVISLALRPWFKREVERRWKEESLIKSTQPSRPAGG